MFKFIKKLISFIVILLAIIGGLIVYTGYSAKQGISNAIDNATEMPANQKMAVYDNVIEIHTPLKENKAIVLENFSACSSTGINSISNYSSFCVNGKCETTIDIEEKDIPSKIRIGKKTGDDKCEVVTFEAPKSLYKTVDYTGEIGINDEAREILGDRLNKDPLKRTRNSKYIGSKTISIGNTKITLTYKTPEKSDEFMYGSALFHVIYK